MSMYFDCRPYHSSDNEEDRVICTSIGPYKIKNVFSRKSPQKNTYNFCPIFRMKRSYEKLVNDVAIVVAALFRSKFSKFNTQKNTTNAHFNLAN